MNVTSQGIAVALAVVVVFGFFLFGIVNPFSERGQAPMEAPGASITDNQELMISDTSMGTGETAMPGDTVTVHYEGRFEDGTVFDASARHGGPFSFTLGEGRVIKGWDQGVAGMKVGGKRTLVVPPELGYGMNDYGPIPGGSTLIFDVELVSVQKP